MWEICCSCFAYYLQPMNYLLLAARELSSRTGEGIKILVRMGKVSFSCVVKLLFHLGGFISSYPTLPEPMPQSGSMPPCLLRYLPPELSLFLIILSLRNLMFLCCVCWHLSINHVPCDFYEIFLPKSTFNRKSEVASWAVQAAPSYGHCLSSSLWMQSPLISWGVGLSVIALPLSSPFLRLPIF